MKPTIGRIVHYYPDESPNSLKECGPGPHAAIITKVNSDTNINITVLADGVEPFSKRNIETGNAPGESCWKWPPREGE